MPSPSADVPASNLWRRRTWSELILKRTVYAMFWMLVVAAIPAFAELFLFDDLTGPAGSPVVGTPFDIGGVWDNELTDGSRNMDGNFVFADGGGVEFVVGNIYTLLERPGPVNSVSNGFSVAVTFRANGYDDFKFHLAMVQTINMGNFSNIDSGDVVRMRYDYGGSDNGCFRCYVYKDDVRLNRDLSQTASIQMPEPDDEVRLSITAFPVYGIFVLEAFNLTENYLISRQPVTVNTMTLTNLNYVGFGINSISVSDSNSPAVVTSFSASTEELPAARPFSMEDNPPPTMTAFAFNDIKGESVADTNYPAILAGHEQVDFLHSVRPSLFQAVREAYPEKIFIDQKGWGSTAGIDEDTVWPGHCLLKVGTTVTNDCAAVTNDTVLYLEDYTRIASSQDKIDNASDSAQYAVLFALDENGKADWSRSEHVKLLTVDTDAGSVTVQRGVQGSVPQAYTAGRVALARHMMFWTNQWQFNLSLHGPRGGPLNMTAAEWFAFQIAQRVFAADADGVEFDVARWQWGYPKSNAMDCDNDLVADYGYIDGINSFGLGAQVMLRELRKRLGPDRIIQMDSGNPLNGQRGWKYVNGVQLESFPSANKFHRFSQTMLHLRRWIERVEHPNAFSYPFTKTPTTLYGNACDTDGSPVDWRFRIGFATALITGMPHPFASLTDINFDPENPEENEVEEVADKGYYEWDEYEGGDLGDWKWLGPPLGEAVQVDTLVETSNLLGQVEWQWKTEAGFSADVSDSGGTYEAVIHAIPSNTITWESSYYPDSEVVRAFWFGVRLDATNGMPSLEPGQEYTLEFEARGNDAWSVEGDVFEKVPRALTINGIVENKNNSPTAVSLDPEWTAYRLSLIAHSNSAPLLSFGFSEQIGDAAIRNIRLYRGSQERYVRSFRNGRVYLNMTLEPWRVYLGTEAVQRLSGSQIPELNNGEVVNGWLTVPSWDAAFLRMDTYDTWRTTQRMGLAVSDTFATGFDGRDAGDLLPGFAVEDGTGTWSNERTDGSPMSGEQAFTNGGVTETVGASSGVYVPIATLNDAFTMRVIVTPNDFRDGSFSIGCVENADKGIFQNIKTGDVLRMRYIHTAPNAGLFQFGVYNDGEQVSGIYSTRLDDEPGPTDTIELTLSYDPASGTASGSVYNATGDYLISSASVSVPGLSSLSKAGFGWAHIPKQSESPSENPGVVSYFMVGGENAEQGGEDEDPDGDGFTNFEEYMAGTDPLDAQSTFSIGGLTGGEGQMELFWPFASNRVYDVYGSTNLMDGFALLEEGIAPPQSSYTNTLSEDGRQEFFKIKVRRP